MKRICGLIYIYITTAKIYFVEINFPEKIFLAREREALKLNPS